MAQTLGQCSVVLRRFQLSAHLNTSPKKRKLDKFNAVSWSHKGEECKPSEVKQSPERDRRPLASSHPQRGVKEQDGPEVQPLLRGAIARATPRGRQTNGANTRSLAVHGLQTHGPETAASKRIICGISALFIRTIRASRLTTAALIIATGRAAGACAACIHTHTNSHRRPRGSAGESGPPTEQPPRDEIRS